MNFRFIFHLRTNTVRISNFFISLIHILEFFVKLYEFSFYFSFTYKYCTYSEFFPFHLFIFWNFSKKLYEFSFYFSFTYKYCAYFEFFPFHVFIFWNFFYFEIFSNRCMYYECHSEVIAIPPPPLPERKIKIHSSLWDSNYFKVFTVEVESSSRPFQPRPEERKKVTFRKELQCRPSIMINSPSSQKLPFPACFLSILMTGENSRWIDDQVKKGGNMIESR